MGEKWWMNVEIKRFSDSGEDSTKATECHKKAVWSKSYVTISLLFHFPKWLDEDAGITTDSYSIVCKIKDSAGHDSRMCSKKNEAQARMRRHAAICLPSSSSTWFNFANKKQSMIRSTFKVLFYLKRNAPKKNRLTPVMYHITVNGKISKSTLIRKLEAGNRNICREYIAFFNYMGKRHTMSFKRRKVEFALLYVP